MFSYASYLEMRAELFLGPHFTLNFRIVKLIRMLGYRIVSEMNVSVF